MKKISLRWYRDKNGDSQCIARIGVGLLVVDKSRLTEDREKPWFIEFFSDDDDDDNGVVLKFRRKSEIGAISTAETWARRQRDLINRAFNYKRVGKRKKYEGD